MLGVIFVNGWTDAPNAIATCVSTRAMKPGAATVAAAFFNFAGVLIMTFLNSKVAATVYNLVDFGGSPIDAARGLYAALLAIVIWATAAWRFGIPTSESHALIAGLTGAVIAARGGFDGINGDEWMKVIYGLLLSTLVGFALGFAAVKAIERICRGADRMKAARRFKNAQIVSAGAMAFIHGAQDGQKFMGIFLLGLFLASGNTGGGEFEIPVWLMILCSAVMALGTSTGGYRIIKSVGMDMVKLQAHQGFAADLAAALCLLAASLTGVPASTTHTKTAAVMGVGVSKGVRAVNWRIAGEIVMTWILTFPGCGLLGYLTAAAFRAVF